MSAEIGGVVAAAGSERRTGGAAADDPFSDIRYEDLQRRTSMKWRTFPADVLPVWVAEMDVAIAGPVTQAVRKALDLGDTGYPVGTGYAEALAAFAANRWGWTFAPSQTAIVPDVMLGIVELLKLTTSSGDAVVVNCPVYKPFYQFVAGIDRRVIEAPLTADHRIDPNTLNRAFEQAVAGARRAAFMLCSPHNPTGTVHTAQELAQVSLLAQAHGVRVIADEIHAPLVLAGARHTPYLSIPGAESAFSVMSASKAWNLAGLKAAVAVAGTGATADLARMPEEVSHGPSHIGTIAHTAALTEGGAWLDALLRALAVNRELLGNLLQEHLPGIVYQPAQGTFLAWLDCRALGLGDDPAQVFLDRGRVALSPGPGFGSGGRGHARLNLATTPQILTEAVRRMVRASL